MPASGRPPDGTVGFIHVDMDAFFASVEILRHPELRNQPVVVGGTGNRGVVAAADYHARAYGIRSAMATIQARRLCKHAVFLPGDHAHYIEVSKRIMLLLDDFTPLIEPLSLDEAFLDVRGVLHGQRDAVDIAREVRRRVFCEEGLTCSVGVAANKFLAKLATQRAKPAPSLDGPVYQSGVHVIEAGRETEFLHPLPVRALWGVGPATEARLAQMGIETIGDIAAQPPQHMVAALGKAVGGHLRSLALGLDDRPVEPHRERRSIGHEETFPQDLVDREQLNNRLLRMADAVASRMRSAATAGRCITIKLRFGDFTTITRSLTLAQPTDGGLAIARYATNMLGHVDIGRGVRLVGVSVSGLVERFHQQLSLDDLAHYSQHDVDEVVDQIRARFGDDAVGPASLVTPGVGLSRMRNGRRQWGPDQGS